MVSSSSRTRSSGAGAVEPVASRMAARRRQRDPGPMAQFREGLAGEGGEDAVGGLVDEVQGEVAVSQPVGQELEGDVRRLEPPDDPHATDITFGESTIAVRRQDGHPDQVVNRLETDPGPFGRLRRGIRLHGPTVCPKRRPHGRR